MNADDLRKLHERVVDPGGKQDGVCPSHEQLLALALDELPSAERASVQLRVEACASCTEDLGTLVQSLQSFEGRRDRLFENIRSRLSVSASEPARVPFGVRLADATREALERLLTGMADLARDLSTQAALQPGFRSAERQKIDAPVDGIATQSPTSVSFEIVRAEIEQDGRFVLELSTRDPVPAGLDRLEVVLLAGSERILLPPGKLFGDGLATLIARLPVAMPLQQIPAACLALRVSSSNDGPS
ncbi:MAG: hypothetical protein ACI9EF_002978 [Pseudohongiellaceae bacterium]|jgi:hypothetical protein